MFINCPNCNALVATDLVSDLPPPQCPRCNVDLHAQSGRAAPPPEGPASAPVMAPAASQPPAPQPQPPPAGEVAPAGPVRFVPLHARELPSTAASAPLRPVITPTARVSTPGSGHRSPGCEPIAERAPGLPPAPAPVADTPSTPPTAGPAASLPAPAPAPVAAGSAALPAAPSAPALPASPPACQTDDASGAGRAPVEAPPASGTAPAPARPAPPAARGTATATESGVVPGFARAAHAAGQPLPPRERRILRVAIPALALLLAVQLLLADRERLAADAGWRPWVSAACTVLRCSLPAWHEPQAITLVQRDVRPHPDHPRVLKVSATLRNDAAHPQAWPMVLLTLSDVDGGALGARWFAPEHYRPGDGPATLAPGATATFHLDVVEPAPHTVAFNFAFG